MVNTQNIQRDDLAPDDFAPKNKKVTVTKKKGGRTPPVPSLGKGDKGPEKNTVIINCTYENKVYELIGFRDKAVSTVYLLLKERLTAESEELDGFPGTSGELSYVCDGKRLSCLKTLGSLPIVNFPMNNESIDIRAGKTSILHIVGSEPSYSGGSSSSDSDDDKGNYMGSDDDKGNDMGTMEDSVVRFI